MVPPQTDEQSAPDSRSRGNDGRLRRWLKVAFGPFWVVPALWCLAAVVAGIAVPELEQQHPRWAPLLFGGGTEGARSLLSTIAGAMISVTGLVFSITIVVLQLASSQFSPRVLRTFLDDRVPQHTLGVFAASFLYALTVLRSITGTGSETGTGAGNDVGSGTGSVPQLAITLAFVLVLGSVAMFLWFIHHITRSISVSSVIQQIGQETRRTLERDEARRSESPSDGRSTSATESQLVACARRSGVLERVDRSLLVRTARRHDVRIDLLHRLGTFVPESAPIALVHGGGSDQDWDALVGAGLGLERERSLEQDLAFGLRQLVDIAERALSPGINDPTTAIQVIDQLHDLLRRVGNAPDPVSVEHDGEGVARLSTSEWSFADLLDLAVDEIAHWGAESIQIPRRLDELFADLATGVDPEHRGVVTEKRAGIERAIAARSGGVS